MVREAVVLRKEEYPYEWLCGDTLPPRGRGEIIWLFLFDPLK